MDATAIVLSIIGTIFVPCLLFIVNRLFSISAKVTEIAVNTATTATKVEAAERAQNECKADRGKIWTRLDEHTKEIGGLNNRLGCVETAMEQQ